MLREQWNFSYPAAELARAAAHRLAYHEERLAWWQAQRAQVMASIRSDGLELNEKLVLSQPSPKSADWERGSRVLVRNDLQEKLDECQRKLRDHTARRRDYDGWLQVLEAHPGKSLELDIEDWLFFFGRN